MLQRLIYHIPQSLNRSETSLSLSIIFCITWNYFRHVITGQGLTSIRLQERSVISKLTANQKLYCNFTTEFYPNEIEIVFYFWVPVDNWPQWILLLWLYIGLLNPFVRETQAFHN